MRLRAYLKDVVLIPDNEWEKEEIIRLTEPMKNKVDAKLAIDFVYRDGEFVVNNMRTIGIVDRIDW